ncbi:MAG: 4-(cytidine 5'-diphospho)-2-C-methyl-D-erythritol kinase [Acidobacteriota bacterium]|nr:4-(cytidine 5'-diphospho)-2-C-methyl-D-erythritol kinase [Acidobacteriota bacterium]
MITLRAPAKLTWYLEVTGRRDDGRHELRSEMCTIDFADELTLEEDADYLRLEGSPTGVADDHTNLVVRALRLVGRRAGVTLRKVIPARGGLGGGSADAAAILRWAGGVPAEVALQLGGDVPFCQVGGTALVEGVGERVTPQPFVARELTLVLTGLEVDTGSCYRAYDQLRREGSPLGGRNELAAAARLVEPRLGAVMDWLAASVGQEPVLAGSGSTLFFEGHVGDEATWRVQGPYGPLQFRHAMTTPA